MMTPIVGADPAKGLVTAEVRLPAHPDAVFAALTEPDQLQGWWGAPQMYRTFDWTIDLRPCGTWSVRMEDSQGNQKSVRGQIMVVDRPRLLVLSWQPSWDQAPPTVIRYELEPEAMGQGTRLRVSHGGFVGRSQSCEEHARDWRSVLEWLDEYLGAGQSVAPA